MKLKCVGFLFLSVLILSGCTTTSSASGIQSKSSQIQSESEKIERLEREVQELKSRISAIEAMLSDTKKKSELVLAGDGWKSLANWRKLKTGMSYESVEKILGSPQRVDGGHRARWHYENFGEVAFFDGEVTDWREPR